MKKLVCIDNPIQCPHRKMYGGLMLCEHSKVLIPGYVKVCPQISMFSDSCPLLDYSKDVVTDSLLFTAENKEGKPIQITSIDKKPETKKSRIFKKPAEKNVTEKNVTVPAKKPKDTKVDDKKPKDTKATDPVKKPAEKKPTEKKIESNQNTAQKKRPADTLKMWDAEETAVIAVAKSIDEAKQRYVQTFGNIRSCDSIRLKWVYLRNAGQLFHKGSKVTVIRKDCIDYGKTGTIFRISDDLQYAVIDLGNNVMVSHKLSYVKAVE